MLRISSWRWVPSCLPGALTAAAAVTLACGGVPQGPPEVLLDRSACEHCRMLISEPVYAAGYRDADRQGVFDDVGCLLEELADGTVPASAELWVHDFSDGGWIAASEAVFVRSTQVPTPMASGIVALKDRAMAAELAARRAGEVFGSFADLQRLVSGAEAIRTPGEDGADGR